MPPDWAQLPLLWTNETLGIGPRSATKCLDFTLLAIHIGLDANHLHLGLWDNCTILWLDNSICVAPVAAAVPLVVTAVPHRITAVQVTAYLVHAKRLSPPPTLRIVSAALSMGIAETEKIIVVLVISTQETVMVPMVGSA
ncbi:hypothetical protein PENANT_c077G01121 [Penicillium antarcticum]|uniref:Uncharacterized protein n=1 Tax=Penicillium antarcticum TaxID=416450 RepID=A0A1V6PPH0_9EURO|nr:hypothetical protein PENANT_c077G01121 [Penicillium antarcticum]